MLLDLGAKYFTWHDVTFSINAARMRLDNTPDDETQATILHTAKCMDALREKLGCPVDVSSWYRSPKVNAAAGSKPTSQHLLGCAVDFTAHKYGTNDEVFAFLKAHMVELGIDQLILEYADHPNGGWIHVSFTDTPRHMAFAIN